MDPEDTALNDDAQWVIGRFLAEASVFLTMARTLAVFNVTNAVDMDGIPLKAHPVQLTGAVR